MGGHVSKRVAPLPHSSTSSTTRRMERRTSTNANIASHFLATQYVRSYVDLPDDTDARIVGSPRGDVGIGLRDNGTPKVTLVNVAPINEPAVEDNPKTPIDASLELSAETIQPTRKDASPLMTNDLTSTVLDCQLHLESVSDTSVEQCQKEPAQIHHPSSNPPMQSCSSEKKSIEVEKESPLGVSNVSQNSSLETIACADPQERVCSSSKKTISGRFLDKVQEGVTYTRIQKANPADFISLNVPVRHQALTIVRKVPTKASVSSLAKGMPAANAKVGGKRFCPTEEETAMSPGEKLVHSAQIPTLKMADASKELQAAEVIELGKCEENTQPDAGRANKESFSLSSLPIISADKAFIVTQGNEFRSGQTVQSAVAAYSSRDCRPKILELTALMDKSEIIDRSKSDTVCQQVLKPDEKSVPETKPVSDDNARDQKAVPSSNKSEPYKFPPLHSASTSGVLKAQLPPIMQKGSRSNSSKDSKATKAPKRNSNDRLSPISRCLLELSAPAVGRHSTTISSVASRQKAGQVAALPPVETTRVHQYLGRNNSTPRVRSYHLPDSKKSNIIRLPELPSKSKSTPISYLKTSAMLQKDFDRSCPIPCHRAPALLSIDLGLPSSAPIQMTMATQALGTVYRKHHSTMQGSCSYGEGLLEAGLHGMKNRSLQAASDLTRSLNSINSRIAYCNHGNDVDVGRILLHDQVNSTTNGSVDHTRGEPVVPDLPQSSQHMFSQQRNPQNTAADHPDGKKLPGVSRSRIHARLSQLSALPEISEMRPLPSSSVRPALLSEADPNDCLQLGRNFTRHERVTELPSIHQKGEGIPRCESNTFFHPLSRPRSGEGRVPLDHLSEKKVRSQDICLEDSRSSPDTPQNN